MRKLTLALAIFLLIGSIAEARYSPALEMAGNISMGGYYLTGLPNPSVPTDAAPWKSVQGANNTHLALAGGTMSNNIAMAGYKVTGLGNGTAAQDAATYSQIASRPLSYIDYTPASQITSTATSWESINATHLNLSFTTQNTGMVEMGFWSGAFFPNVANKGAYFSLFVDGADTGINNWGLASFYDYTYRSYKIVNIKHFVSLSAGHHYVEPKWYADSGGENAIWGGWPIIVYARPMF